MQLSSGLACRDGRDQGDQRCSCPEGQKGVISCSRSAVLIPAAVCAAVIAAVAAAVIAAARLISVTRLIAFPWFGRFRRLLGEFQLCHCFQQQVKCLVNCFLVRTVTIEDILCRCQGFLEYCPCLCGIFVLCQGCCRVGKFLKVILPNRFRLVCPLQSFHRVQDRFHCV